MSWLHVDEMNSSAVGSVQVFKEMEVARLCREGEVERGLWWWWWIGI